MTEQIDDGASEQEGPPDGQRRPETRGKQLSRQGRRGREGAASTAESGERRAESREKSGQALADVVERWLHCGLQEGCRGRSGWHGGEVDGRELLETRRAADAPVQAVRLVGGCDAMQTDWAIGRLVCQSCAREA